MKKRVWLFALILVAILAFITLFNQDASLLTGNVISSLSEGLKGGLFIFSDEPSSSPSGPPSYQGSGEDGAINIKLVPSRISGVAPLSVHFDASGTNATATNRPFHHLDYTWDFGDPNSGTWAASGKSKNSAKNPIAAHVYENPGTYLVTLNVKDGQGGIASEQVTITVTNPDNVFSGTSTVCFSNTQNFTGCPAGASHVTTNSFNTIVSYLTNDRRLLFKRGDSFLVGETVRLTNVRTGIIGAFGACSNPNERKICENNPRIFNTNSSNPMITTEYYGNDDWRIMDLHADGIGDLLGGAQGTVSNLTLFRTLIEDAPTGFGLSHWNILGHDAITIYESEIINSTNIGVYIGSERLGILGSKIKNSRLTHALRVWQGYKSVIDNNILEGASHSRSYDGRHALKLHSPLESSNQSINEFGCDMIGVHICKRTEYVVVSNNIFGSSGPWPLSVGPQGGDVDERVSNVIVDSNRFIASYGIYGEQVQVHAHICARGVTIRNNIFDGTAANMTYYTAIGVQKRGIEPAPEKIEIYHNTVYNLRTLGAGEMRFLSIRDVTDQTIVKNNIMYTPNSPSPAFIINNGLPYVATNNLYSQVNPLFVDPNNANPFLRDFRVQQGSPAIDSGGVVPVYADFNDLPRPQENASDIGAFEYFNGDPNPLICPSITQYGITWNFSEPYPTCGQFVNGDWWVVGPVRIDSVDPAPIHSYIQSTTSCSCPWSSSYCIKEEIVNNACDSSLPSPYLGQYSYSTSCTNNLCTYVAGRHGNWINPEFNSDYGQPFDSRIGNGFYGGRYNSSIRPSMWTFNSTTYPYGASLVSSVSHPDTRDCAGGWLTFSDRPTTFNRNCNGGPVKSFAILTILNQTPLQDSFRPAYNGLDKSIRFSKSQINYSALGSIAPTGSILSYPISEVYRHLQRPNLQTIFWANQGSTASDNANGYGQFMAADVSLAALILNLNTYTSAEKEPLMIALLQYGIDFYGVYKNSVWTDTGTYTGVKNRAAWYGLGGHGQGRMFPILFAGKIFNDYAMANTGYDAPNDYYFSERAQTFTVTDYTGVSTGTALKDILVHSSYCSSGGVNCNQGGYLEQDIGLPEFGFSHYHGTNADDKTWTGNAYRRCCTANAWGGYLLASHAMGIKDLWNSQTLFDYMDRYMTATSSSGASPASSGDLWHRGWIAPLYEMWDARRNDFGCKWVADQSSNIYSQGHYDCAGQNVTCVGMASNIGTRVTQCSQYPNTRALEYNPCGLTCGAQTSFDFSISRNPTSGSVQQGSSVQTTVTATYVSGTATPVTFSASNLSSGVTPVFNPASCTPQSGTPCSSTLTLTASGSATIVNNQQVSVVGTSGSVIRSTSYSLTVTSTPTAPATPTLSATTLNTTSIRLNWNDVSNENNYTLQRRTGTSGTYTTIASPLANIVVYTDNLLNSSTTYQYQIRANNNFGSSIWSSLASATTFTCNNSATRPCANQVGVCSGSYETCTSGQWPGCNYSTISGYNVSEMGSVMCRDGKDNDCDGRQDYYNTTVGGDSGCPMGITLISVPSYVCNGTNFTLRCNNTVSNVQGVWTWFTGNNNRGCSYIGWNGTIIENNCINAISTGLASCRIGPNGTALVGYESRNQTVVIDNDPSCRSNPVLERIDPLAIYANENSTITFTGSGFSTSLCGVKVSGFLVPSSLVQCISPSQINFTLPSTLAIPGSYALSIIGIYAGQEKESASFNVTVSMRGDICGDGTCGASENCNSCESDCGACPPGPSTGGNPRGGSGPSGSGSTPRSNTSTNSTRNESMLNSSVNQSGGEGPSLGGSGLSAATKAGLTEKQAWIALAITSSAAILAIGYVLLQRYRKQLRLKGLWQLEAKIMGKSI